MLPSVCLLAEIYQLFVLFIIPEVQESIQYMPVSKIVGPEPQYGEPVLTVRQDKTYQELAFPVWVSSIDHSVILFAFQCLFDLVISFLGRFEISDFLFLYDLVLPSAVVFRQYGQRVPAPLLKGFVKFIRVFQSHEMSAL